jgi:hypothetical protein
MTDIGAISAFLTSLKSATDIAKAIKSVEVSLERAELKLRVAELIESLAATKMHAAEIQDLVREKDSEIERLQIDQELFFEDNAYWRMKNSAKDGPFCTDCWDRERMLVHEHRDDNGHWYCRTHGQPDPFIGIPPEVGYAR